MDLVSPVVTAIIGAFTIYLIRNQVNNSKNQYKQQSESNKKQNQIRGLLEAFKTLDSEKHREYRKEVFILYFEYFEKGNVKRFKYSNAVANVRADFDIMGKLVKSENIDRNEFLEEYGSLVYRCWRCIEDHINDERKYRNFSAFMTWFEWLAYEGYKYWKDEREAGRQDLDDSVLFHPDGLSKPISFKTKSKRSGSPINLG